jgi:hypothetical protein
MGYEVLILVVMKAKLFMTFQGYCTSVDVETPHLVSATAVDRWLNRLLADGHRHMHLCMGIAVLISMLKLLK